MKTAGTFCQLTITSSPPAPRAIEIVPFEIMYESTDQAVTLLTGS